MVTKATKTVRRINPSVKKFRDNKSLLAMCLPAIIKTIIFAYLPMVGLIIAFKNYTPKLGIFGSEWNGFANFEFFFKSNTAWDVIRNTIGLNFLNIILSTVVNVCLALFLYEVTSRRCLKVYQTVLFIPYFFSWVLVGLMLTVLLSSTSGVLTNAIYALSGEKINFYTQPNYWIAILPIINTWKGAGFGSIIYYSCLMNIDRELFEAAEIDGATKLQRIWNICIPFLKPMICVLTIMAIGGIVRADFGLFYFVPRNQAQLYPVTDVIDTYVYRALAENGDFGMSTAIGLIQSVLGFILVLGSNKIANMFDRDYALF